jgi:virulence factor Mce-like protein
MRRQGVADNPVLVGAGAVLVILVMVLLSYNANSGLPFVPTYDITADVPNGAALVKGNDVRIGGARVGTVVKITAEREDEPATDEERYYAQVSLKLDKNIGPIPANSTIEVRPKSTIGLKYVELTLGNSEETIPNGGNLPLSQATTAVEFEDLLNTFDERVREGNRRSLDQFGNAFAGRGADLNYAFGQIAPLFENLEPVARVVGDKDTQLARFIRVLARVATDYAATGENGYTVWVNADRTFAAFAAASRGIQESLEEAPSTIRVVTETFPAERKYFAQLTDTIERFQPGAPYLPQVASNLASITRNGPRAMNHLYRLSPQFDTTLTKLGTFAADSQVRLGLNGLINFVADTKQPLEHITPAQTKCNYFGIFARNLASAVSSRDDGTSWLRFGAVAGWPNQTPRQNSEVGPANGLSAFNGGQNDAFGGLQWGYLKSNPKPTTGQNNVCGAGNEVTLGNTSLSGFPQRMSDGVVTTQPGNIKSGKTTPDTVQQGSEQVMR